MFIAYLLENKIATTATALIPMMVQLISVCKRGLCFLYHAISASVIVTENP